MLVLAYPRAEATLGRSTSVESENSDPSSARKTFAARPAEEATADRKPGWTSGRRTTLLSGAFGPASVANGRGTFRDTAWQGTKKDCHTTRTKRAPAGFTAPACAPVRREKRRSLGREVLLGKGKT